MARRDKGLKITEVDFDPRITEDFILGGETPEDIRFRWIHWRRAENLTQTQVGEQVWGAKGKKKVERWEAIVGTEAAQEPNHRDILDIKAAGLPINTGYIYEGRTDQLAPMVIDRIWRGMAMDPAAPFPVPEPPGLPPDIQE